MICKECGEYKGDWLANKLRTELAGEREKSQRLYQALEKIKNDVHVCNTNHNYCGCYEQYAEEALREYGGKS